MRFQSKFVPESWIWLFIVGINTALALDRTRLHRPSLLGFIDLIAAFVVLLGIYGQKTIFWEMDTEGLRQRRLWINTKIEWQSITRVESLWFSFYDLKIEYNRDGFGPRIGRILANPADRDAFLDSLRRFAPQAVFVEKSSTKILDI